MTEKIANLHLKIVSNYLQLPYLRCYSGEILTIELFMNHTPLFSQILFHIQSKMWPTSGVWGHKKLDSKDFSTAQIRNDIFLSPVYKNNSDSASKCISPPLFEFWNSKLSRCSAVVRVASRQWIKQWWKRNKMRENWNCF